MPKKGKKKEIIEAEVEEKAIETETNNKKKMDINISTTLIMGVIGLILVLLPEESNKLIGYIIGGAFLIAGAVSIIKYFKDQIKPSSLSLVSGILYALLGLIIVLNPLSIMKLVTIIFGIYLIVNGALKVHSAYAFKDTPTNTWKNLLISGVIIDIFGLILIINPFSGLIITKVAGAFLLIVAIYDIINQYIINK